MAWFGCRKDASIETEASSPPRPRPALASASAAPFLRQNSVDCAEIGRGNAESPAVQLENALRLLRFEKEERGKMERALRECEGQLSVAAAKTEELEAERRALEEELEELKTADGDLSRLVDLGVAPECREEVLEPEEEHLEDPKVDN